MLEHISLLVAFGAGLLSFLSPCVVPLVPVFLASLSGPEIFEHKASRIRLPTFLHSLSFVGGFSIIFVTFFIDKDGIIQEKIIGAFPNKEVIEGYLSKIIP